MFSPGTLLVVQVNQLLLWLPRQLFLSKGEVVMMLKSNDSDCYFLTHAGIFGRSGSGESWERWFRQVTTE
jgi:hypothetical protein